MQHHVGNFTLLVSAVRAADTTVTLDSVLNPVDNAGNPRGADIAYKGYIFYLNISAVPGGDTVKIQLQEQDPLSGTWTTVVQTNVQVNIAMVTLRQYAGGPEIAASATEVVTGRVISNKVRAKVVHSGAGNFTYSLSVTPLN